jgi:predicted RNase H-like HicB family nuclease
MKTYAFPVVVEPDEDRWFAYCPPLLEQGGSTWGHTRQEALENIEEVVKLVVESLVEHGEPVPEGNVAQTPEPLVAVTL